MITIGAGQSAGQTTEQTGGNAGEPSAPGLLREQSLLRLHKAICTESLTLSSSTHHIMTKAKFQFGLAQFCVFTAKYGNGNFTRHASNALRDWALRLQVARDKLPASVDAVLKQHGFWGLDGLQPFDLRVEQLRLHREMYGNCGNIDSYFTHPDLLYWIESQKAEYKRQSDETSPVLEDRWKKLRELKVLSENEQKVEATDLELPTGGEWRRMVIKLQKFIRQTGHSNVPNNLFNKELFPWVKKQRELFDWQVLPRSQFNLLNKIGFTWSRQSQQSTKGKPAHDFGPKKSSNKKSPLAVRSETPKARALNASLESDNVNVTTALSSRKSTKGKPVHEVGPKHSNKKKSPLSVQPEIPKPQALNSSQESDNINETTERPSRKQKAAAPLWSTKIDCDLKFMTDSEWKRGLELYECFLYSAKERKLHEPQPHLSEWILKLQVMKRVDIIPEAISDFLNSHHFAWNETLSLWDLRLQQLKVQKKLHGDLNKTTGYFSNPELFLWLEFQRCCINTIIMKFGRGNMNTRWRKREAMLTELGVTIPIQLKTIPKDLIAEPETPACEDWHSRQMMKLHEFVIHRGHAYIPSTHQDKELVAWVTEQRQLYYCQKLSYGQFYQLVRVGFAWTNHAEALVARLETRNLDNVAATGNVCKSAMGVDTLISRKSEVLSMDRLSRERIAKLRPAGLAGMRDLNSFDRKRHQNEAKKGHTSFRNHTRIQSQAQSFMNPAAAAEMYLRSMKRDQHRDDNHRSDTCAMPPANVHLNTRIDKVSNSIRSSEDFLHLNKNPIETQIREFGAAALLQTDAPQETGPYRSRTIIQMQQTFKRSIHDLQRKHKRLHDDAVQRAYKMARTQGTSQLP